MVGDRWSAAWRSGLAATPAGSTCYLSNALETIWRRLKGLLPRNFHTQDVSQLVVEVVASSRRLPNSEEYSSMKFSHPDIHAFVERALPLHSRRNAAGSQSKRLTGDDLVNHHKEAGDIGTFESRAGDFEIVVDGVTFAASQLWVFPKYDLTLASTYPEDLVEALDLTLGSLEEKRSILSPEGDYSYNRHRFLRTNYATTAVLTSGDVIDLHSDFIRNAGQTEHTIFTKVLLGTWNATRPPQGVDLKQQAKAGPKKKSKELKEKVTTPARRSRQRAEAEVAEFFHGSDTESNQDLATLQALFEDSDDAPLVAPVPVSPVHTPVAEPREPSWAREASPVHAPPEVACRDGDPSPLEE